MNIPLLNGSSSTSSGELEEEKINAFKYKIGSKIVSPIDEEETRPEITEEEYEAPDEIG